MMLSKYLVWIIADLFLLDYIIILEQAVFNLLESNILKVTCFNSFFFEICSSIFRRLIDLHLMRGYDALNIIVTVKELSMIWEPRLGP